jgi:hypothetical protein
MIMKNTVTDELVNKIYHLTKALDTAKDAISTLQKENENLKSLLENISGDHIEYHEHEYAGAV